MSSEHNADKINGLLEILNLISTGQAVGQIIETDGAGGIRLIPTPTGGGGGPDEFICKTADESVFSSTVLQDDDELRFDVAAGEKWYAILTMYFTDVVAEPPIGIKYTIDLGSGAPAVAFWAEVLGTSDFAQNFGAVRIIAPSDVSVHTQVIHITLDNTGGDATEFKLRWAQGSSDVGAVKVKKGSTLLAWKQP